MNIDYKNVHLFDNETSGKFFKSATIYDGQYLLFNQKLVQHTNVLLINNKTDVLFKDKKGKRKRWIKMDESFLEALRYTEEGIQNEA